ncbi:MAG: hypothetical protein IAF08_16505 [Rhizobacter sp.]|nr:hypothetical protein [Chlorobiales bacterium]
MKVLMMTGYLDTQHSEDFAKDGTLVVAKPFDFKTLLSAIHQALSQK